MSPSTPRTPTPSEDLPVRRIDRVLAFMSLGLLLLSIVCFLVIILAKPLGVTDYSGPFWGILGAIVWIAPPIAFLLLVTVLIMTFIRKARVGKGR